MRRRAFVQLSGVYAAGVVLPAITGCSGAEPTGPDPASSPAAPSQPGQPGVAGVDATLVSTGSTTRAFASDGSSVSLATVEHYVDVFSPTGGRLGRIGDPSRVGSGAVGTLNAPIAAEWDGARLLVLELGNSRIQAFAPSGAPLGVVTSTSRPSDMAFDPNDRTIYVASGTKHRIEVYGPDGQLLRTFGCFGTNGAGLNGPASLAFAPDGKLHVVDIGSSTVKVFADGRYVGQYGGGASTSGAPLDGQLVGPRSIRFDSQGRAWVADTLAAVIRVYDARGGFVAKVVPRMGDGSPAAPMALAHRPDGTLYAAVLRAS